MPESLETSPYWLKARALDVEAEKVRAGKRDYFFWLGEMDRTELFSTLHMCANVWRAAAVLNAQ